MCEDKKHLNFRLSCVLNLTFWRQETRSFLCSRLACVAEIKAVASVWSHSADFFIQDLISWFVGAFWKAEEWSTYMSIRVRYTQIGLYVLRTRQYWERTLLKLLVVLKNTSEIVKQMQYDASTTDRHDPDQPLERSLRRNKQKTQCQKIWMSFHCTDCNCTDLKMVKKFHFPTCVYLHFNFTQCLHTKNSI